jgi:phosphatidylinositol-3-phosphatase
MGRVASFAVGVVGAAAMLLGTAVATQAAANLIANGSFEGSGSGSLSGWGGSSGKLSLVAGDGGGHAARITVSGSPAQMYAYTTTKPVKSTTAGTTYDLSGSISSTTAGQTVCLKLKEQPAGKSTNVGTGQQCLTTTTAWQDFPVVAYTAVKSGDTLTVNVAEAKPKAKASFDIDNLSLVVAGVDSQAPTVPQNVKASSSSSTTADVTWEASTDNVGVAGYTILRGGSAVGSVNGSTLSFHDTNLTPSTPYSYTVEAFDAAGNTSAQSSPPAQVTTLAGGGGGGGPCGILPMPGSGPTYSHVIVIMDENLGYDALVGSPQAPYTNQVASECALATNAVGATHPSQPNYIALMSGQLVPWTGSAKNSSADNLLHQLDVAGMGWTALEENMPADCDSSSVFPYKTGHNPAVWFTDLGSGGDGSCKKDDVPFTVSGFDPAGLPAFTFITPNQCNDMHWVTGCAGSKADRIQTGDAWLQSLLPQIFQSADYQAGNTIVILTWDEGDEAGTTGIDCTTVANPDSAGCHIATIAMSAYITPGTQDSAAYSDYSVLGAIEKMWGLPLLGKAQTATPLGAGMGF